MSLSQYDMIDLAKEGASLTLDVSDFGQYETQDIAKAIQDGCILELHGCNSKGSSELREIAQSAPGKVKFVF
jgi:hypothetical protein